MHKAIAIRFIVSHYRRGYEAGGRSINYDYKLLIISNTAMKIINFEAVVCGR